MSPSLQLVAVVGQVSLVVNDRSYVLEGKPVLILPTESRLPPPWVKGQTEGES